MCMCIYNMLSPFSFLCLHVYVFRANLGIRQFQGYGIWSLWELISASTQFSLSQESLTSCSFLPRDGIMQTFPVPTTMSTGSVIMQVMLRAHGCSFPVVSRRFSLAAGRGHGPMVLTNFPPHFSKIFPEP